MLTHAPVEALDSTLFSAFGHRAFRPGQREIIESVLAGRKTIAVLPTGSGKSLCYQLPALLLEGVTLVVSPLIALMKDQVDALRARGIRAGCISSNQPAEEWRQTVDSFRAGSLKLLYVSPERFANARFMEMLAAAKIALFAVDEAHCVSEWGHDFRPDYRRLGDAITLSRAPKVLALTATATKDVREDVAKSLGMLGAEVVVRGFNRPNLHFDVVDAGGEADKYARAHKLLGQYRGRGSAIVYASTRAHAENAAEYLKEHGHKASPYHAGLTPDRRSRTQEAFQSGKLEVIVATNAFGMGIDKSDVRVIVHVGLPRSLDAYYQEVGRAGRDGHPGRAVLLFNFGDVKLAEWLIENSGGDSDGQVQRSAHENAVLRQRELNRLNAMVRYATTSRCRRQQILDYFDDPETVICTGCDVCSTDGARPLSDGEHLQVRKLLSVVARMKGRFGRAKIVAVAMGDRSDEVARYQLDQLQSFGVLGELSRDKLLDLLSALEGAQCVASTPGEYPTVALTARGTEVMQDRLRIDLKFKAAKVRAVAPRLRKKKGGGGRAVKRDVEAEDDEPVSEELISRLRSLRKTLSAGLPAYIVFPDKVLMEIARKRPKSLVELASISGVGPAKLEKYGAAFVKEIERFARK